MRPLRCYGAGQERQWHLTPIKAPALWNTLVDVSETKARNGRSPSIRSSQSRCVRFMQVRREMGHQMDVTRRLERIQPLLGHSISPSTLHIWRISPLTFDFVWWGGLANRSNGWWSSRTREFETCASLSFRYDSTIRFCYVIAFNFNLMLYKRGPVIVTTQYPPAFNIKNSINDVDIYLKRSSYISI